jgi:NAD+ kinase
MYRFRLGFLNGSGLEEMEHFSFNVWSSGIWFSTATGSSAVMRAAGGEVMPTHSRELQYMIREHLVEDSMEHLRDESHGMVSEGSKVRIRWNSQVYICTSCILLHC